MASIISIENLSKKYQLGGIHQPYLTFRDNVFSLFSHKSRKKEYFYALKDLTFSIEQGESVGIIGKNGAGKSTLLKILSRITPPTNGRIVLRGRVASLLEVGTGFHGELSGRENIYFNGSILGMKRKEIQRKFDEIIDFSGIEKFLDTPVKHYSSGMHVRLAFAVAAHLEPEILVVDEVLSVGDAEFQKKCLGKMNEVTRGGRTVLFVSHNMGAINSLCSKCILLNSGTVVAYDITSNVILKYYSNEESTSFFETKSKIIGDSDVELICGWLENTDGKLQNSFNYNEEFYICMKYRVLVDQKNIAVPNFHIYYTDGSCAFITQPSAEKSKEKGIFLAKCKIPRFFLNNHTYFVGLAITSYRDVGFVVNFFEQSALSFVIKDEMNYKEINRYKYNSDIPGVVRPLLQWETFKI